MDDIKSYALVGVDQAIDHIKTRLAELEKLRAKLLNYPKRPRKDKVANTAAAKRQRKPLSAAARKRIARAQRLRWARHRKQLAAAMK